MTNNYNANSGIQVFDTPDKVAAFQRLAQYHACKLQLLGMKHSSGRSIIKHVKQTYGFTGSNAAVVEQFKQLLVKEGILK